MNLQEQQLKKLTGKNQHDYEEIASYIVDNADVNLFGALIEKDDFLFDFVKQNVSKRLSNAVNINNFKNLFKLMAIYSPTYDEFIAKSLAKYADEDVTDDVLDMLKNGTDDEKAYCAKFFTYVQDSLALEDLRKNAFAEFEPLATNCARTLSALNDTETLNLAIKKLEDNDEFESYKAVKFISAYGDKKILPKLFEILKTTTMAENITSEIFYLAPISKLFNIDFVNTLFALLHLINGLGETIPLSTVFDFELYNTFESLLKQKGSKSELVLISAYDKFNTLTENDEYLFDEDKETKKEVNEIKTLLSKVETININVDEEVDENSIFCIFAADYTKNDMLLRKILTSSNPTLILKGLENLKKLNALTGGDKDIALKNVTDENIRAIIKAL